MKNKTFLFTVILAVMMVLPCVAQSDGLEVGDRVKTFSAKADNGKTWKSKHVVGEKKCLANSNLGMGHQMIYCKDNFCHIC